MRRFAELLDRLTYMPGRNGKLRLIGEYLATAPDPDRGWAIAVLTGSLALKVQVRRVLSQIMDDRSDPVLYRLSRDYVGDTAETVALLWPEPASSSDPPRLSDVVQDLMLTRDQNAVAALIAGWLDRLDATGRWALLKVITGGLRIGVSARLAKTALAALGDRDVAEVEELWHGVQAPYEELFAWLEARAEKPDIDSRAVFRPLMLAHPLDDGELDGFDPSDFAAEWKWDGIRVQLSSVGGQSRLFSRTGDDIAGAFPDVIAQSFGDAVLDGELLVLRDGAVAPFNDLQQRLNRKTVTARLQAEFPAHIRFYDILFRDGRDLRDLSFEARRGELERWFGAVEPDIADLSEMVPFATFGELRDIWSETRVNGIEGLMLKRRASPYLAGRPKGHWFKWKRAPLTADTVLMYAQRGSGKRSSFYSDLTFGTWRDDGDGGVELVPVGKAYSGFSDEELKRLDRWVRNNTTDRYGPVRAVKPELVIEVAFDAVHLSKRHKSGVAMRFPRVHRIRWDKPASEADVLETVTALIDAG